MKVTDDQEYVAREMQRYDFTAMPVLDNEGMFVGIITIDDAIDVLTDESTEDMQKMAAILPDDDATTYFGTSVWTHAKQRIPWLLILMLSATFTGMVTTHYEEAFVSLPLLVSFMPMLMDTAGNCGNQISTLMVRGLALGEVEPSDFLKVLGKELRVSAIVGAVLGLVNGLRIYLMYTYLYAGQYDNVIGTQWSSACRCSSASSSQSWWAVCCPWPLRSWAPTRPSWRPPSSPPSWTPAA